MMALFLLKIMMNNSLSYCCIILLVFLLSSGSILAQLDEQERRLEFHKRGYKFPPETFAPDTPGWRKLNERRFNQIQHIQDRSDRYRAWVIAAISAYVQQNFTREGWGLTRGPEWLSKLLRKEIKAGIPNARLEPDVDVIDGDAPWFIDKPALNEQVLHEMQPILEAWSGIPLKGITAYGFRLYRNQSSLVMHLDETRTHVISAIYHIDSSEDAEPWPLLIEDYYGNTNEVVLLPGDILLYESSKCVHGRPSKFNGSWYSSVFVHFAPASIDWALTDQSLEGHYGVPPDWDKEATTEPIYPELVMKGAALTEPSCKHSWCGTNDTVKFFGPGEEGYVLTANNHRYSLYGRENEEPGAEL
jgi:hypothetical protein